MCQKYPKGGLIFMEDSHHLQSFVSLKMFSFCLEILPVSYDIPVLFNKSLEKCQSWSKLQWFLCEKKNLSKFCKPKLIILKH